PSAPAITSVMDDVGPFTGNIQKEGITDDARPAINGTAQAGMLVSIYLDGVLAGTTHASGTGEWSFTPDSDLLDGRHEITATAANSLGNVSPATGVYVIHVDTLPPQLAEASLWDDVGGITGQITNGTVTDDSTPSFVGKAEPNATVVIYDDGQEIGRAQVDADGDWVFTPGTPLLDGDHGLSHAVIDPAGNLGSLSEEIAFKVDTTKVVISIDGANDDAGRLVGSIVPGGVTDDATPTLHGRATAGGTVTVYEGSMVLGQAVAGSDGVWSFTPTIALSEGAHALTATVTTIANGESPVSAVFDLTVDLTAPAKPTIEQVLDDVGAPQGALGHGQSTDDTTPTLSGRAEVGSTVHISDNGSLLGMVVTDAAGNWSFTPSPPLLNGVHEFTVKAEDKAGNISEPSDVFAITIDTVPPAPPLITTVYDDQGDQHGVLK
ncbi:MAG: Ig-like domain-containing protein, partial [Stenotrophomonas sp.]